MPLAVLKNLMLFLSYLLFGLTAHAIIRDRVLAVIATLGLITFPHISYEAQRDLYPHGRAPVCSLHVRFFFVRALQRPTVVNYAMAGVSIGIGILSKYNFVVLPLAAAIALLPDRQLRRRLFDWRALLMVAVGAAIVTPHALWFLDHVGTATAETSRS